MGDKKNPSATQFFVNHAPSPTTGSSSSSEDPPYVLVAQGEMNAFSEEASDLMRTKGYKPQGGVFVAMAAKGPVFCQAMVL